MIALSIATLYQGRADALKHARETSANLVSIISNDVARSVEFLLGDGGRNITGTVMTIDAGNTA